MLEQTGLAILYRYHASRISRVLIHAQLGAILHSIGRFMHLDTGSEDQTPISIMHNFGYEYINRSFILSEPPSVRSVGVKELQDSHMIGWSRVNAIQLRYHPLLSRAVVHCLNHFLSA